MKAHRFHLPTAELKKIARLEMREVDAITRRRACRRDHQEARQAVERQALRDALWPASVTTSSPLA
jgi:hypothetical protein